MSDSEDDDDDLQGDDNNKANNTDARNDSSQEIKPNGVNKSTNAKSNNSNNTTKESRTNSSSTSRSLRSNQRPRNSAAINVISNTNETILPQRNHPINNEISSNNINNNTNNNDGNDNVEHKKNKKNHNGENGSSNKIHKKRRCNDTELSDDLPTSSRNSNNRYRNELYEDHTTSTTSLSNTSSSLRETSPKSQTLQSPVKRRKMSISDYIKVRSELNNGNNNEDEDEFNNNETNNNDIFAMDNVNMNISNNNNNIHNGQITPQRPNLNNRDVGSYEYNHLSMSQHNNSNNINNNSYLFTPDSGVSLNNSTTPSTIDHNDIQASTSTTTRIVSYLSPCYEHNDCDVKKVEDHDGDNNNNDDDDEGVVVINNRRTNLNQFQQKVARVRRNYRKQFFDDTESD